MAYFPSLYLWLSLCMRLGDVGEEDRIIYCEAIMYEVRITDILSSDVEDVKRFLACEPSIQ